MTYPNDLTSKFKHRPNSFKNFQMETQNLDQTALRMVSILKEIEIPADKDSRAIAPGIEITRAGLLKIRNLPDCKVFSVEVSKIEILTLLLWGYYFTEYASEAENSLFSEFALQFFKTQHLWAK